VEVSESPFQVQNTSIFVKGSVLRSFITKVRWMLRLRWLERCALPVSCQSSRTAVTVEDAEGDEVVQSGKPLFSEAGRL